MKIRRIQWLSAFLLLAVTTSGYPSLALRVSAQGATRTFPETGKALAGKFLQYWDTHGGLAQQGYPISNEMQEKSDTDGKTYLVQYFERAVFELHPENAAPNDVLLSLLGVSTYQQKYGAGGATGQLPNTSAGSVLFSQTGKRLGGAFLDYWNTHGGVAQQGYPISDPFVETSAADGKTYTVQYFERAVFELHSENAAPNNVLLSLLGRFQYDRKYGPGAAKASPTAKPGGPTATAVPPTAVPDPNSTCEGTPASINMTVTPNCSALPATFRFSARGFDPNEDVTAYTTTPDQAVYGPGSSDRPFSADANGNLNGLAISLPNIKDLPRGVWAATFEGLKTHRKAIGYFKVLSMPSTPTPQPAPPGATAVPQSCDVSDNVDGESTPTGGKVGTTLMFRARGFKAGESVSYWFTLPSGEVFGTDEPVPPGLVNRDGTIGPLPFTIVEADLQAGGAGRWALTFQGADSKHTSVIHFCIFP